MPGMAFYDRILPFPALLRNWKRESRQRPSGAQDKVPASAANPIIC